MAKKKNKKKDMDTEKLPDFFMSEDELDYHEMGPLTPFDIEDALGKFLEEMYIKKNRYVTIVTGKGQVVRPLVDKLLNRNKFVEKYKTAGYFNGQNGAFEVYLKTK